jgi:hypothetical protein
MPARAGLSVERHDARPDPSRMQDGPG